MAVIEAEGLWKIFGGDPERARTLAKEGMSKAEVKEETGSVIAVDDANFEVQEQEIFVVMGLSGSGKSTLLRCVNRLIEPTFGKVHVHDDEVTAFDEDRLRKLRRTKMSMVFQNFGLFPHRTVIGNVEYGLEVAGMDKEKRRGKARQSLELVGLDGYEDSQTSQLSGGMQQRVGLARALVNDPEILLMDEAFSALDPLIRADMQNELLELQEQWDPACTILFITHDLDEALKMGDRIAIMKDGRIAQIGTPTEILTEPADEYVRSFVENVDRTKIVPARTVMRALGDDETVAADGPSVSPHTPIAELLPALVDADGPLAVRDSGGTLQGVVSQDAVMEEVVQNADGARRRDARAGRTDEDPEAAVA
ncbi:glycine betaine/proline transport system ATP-binding protein [Salinibacter ruber]|uniref:Glycine betaine/L-proline transport ATP binding protein n=3 Tax=Salinibacter ruber TaxID=146919 RepID=Q2S5F5_SALRD|nr:glycine betaine/L-proline ABC transporter ATP-binding protein [Salinibacter ruber]ABC45098.1 glycine betaine/L-proline transport ATP binding protein [Salinibacter ruber DSM 13855]MBB4061041.1 glycine betaine/proline transport system ATP-binding protein [Salinibacter ruber]MBB4069973.1 glycine betaine/proline transport system ATP-binding protein [Salinibacter ruber]MCS3635067.1 glycine betaine/proline transport system ATP-binding protein [Salinibacter ruber]MCS3637991.1 glycine betaine/proli